MFSMSWDLKGNLKIYSEDAIHPPIDIINCLERMERTYEGIVESCLIGSIRYNRQGNDVDIILLSENAQLSDSYIKHIGFTQVEGECKYPSTRYKNEIFDIVLTENTDFFERITIAYDKCKEIVEQSDMLMSKDCANEIVKHYLKY